MIQARWFRAFGLAAFASICALALTAQTADTKAIQEKLNSQIRLTKATADRSDIVTPGDVVVLEKDGLMMCASNSSYAYSNSYSNGVLAANYNNRAKSAAKSYARAFGLSRFGLGGGASVTDAANNGCPSRKFVSGEKFWITGIDIQKDGILVSTFSDPYPDSSGNQVRYYGEIKFPIENGQAPSPDDFVKTVSEVFTVQPAGENGGQDNQGGQGAQPGMAPAAAAPMPAIAPPPPPPDAPPPTVALGQTMEQVKAGFGQPLREAKLGAKVIFYYHDMKVTFRNGKVTDVE